MVERKPTDAEIDFHGITHRGLKRESNQDHYLISTVHRCLSIHQTSLADTSSIPAMGERMAFLAMVADGVGGTAGGETASRTAIENITAYIAQCMKCYYASAAPDDSEFLNELQEAAMRAHSGVIERAAGDPEYRGMATTLTLWLGVWPRSYLLQVGDSRCYVYRHGELTQLSRDQTMAEQLVAAGVMQRAEADRTRWADVLASSIGGPETLPVVTRIDQEWGGVGMLCTDGLTKHVDDARIRHRLATMTSARQVCEDLVQDALDGGGSDNITIIVARTVST